MTNRGLFLLRFALLVRAKPQGKAHVRHAVDSGELAQ